MQKVKQVAIDNTLSINSLEDILKKNDFIQLKFESLKIFDNIFNKFSSILYEYSEKIVSLYAPSKGEICPDTIKILSDLEDILETPIGHIVVDACFSDDIKDFINFYVDDLNDGSLNISINCSNYNNAFILSGPIETIAFIERSKIFGISMCIDLDELNQQFRSMLLFDSYKPYLSAIIGCRDLECYGLWNDKWSMNIYEGMYIKK